MSARTSIEKVLADIFNQYLPPGTGLNVYPGRSDNVVTTPYFIVSAHEVTEVVSGSSQYLADVSFIVVTSSTDSKNAMQTTNITNCMAAVRQICNVMREEGMVFADQPTGILVLGMCQMSQIDLPDTQSFGDRVDLRVGFRECDPIQFNLAIQTPVV